LFPRHGGRGFGRTLAKAPTVPVVVCNNNPAGTWFRVQAQPGCPAAPPPVPFAKLRELAGGVEMSLRVKPKAVVIVLLIMLAGGGQ